MRCVHGVGDLGESPCGEEATHVYLPTGPSSWRDDFGYDHLAYCSAHAAVVEALDIESDGWTRVGPAEAAVLDVMSS